VKDTLIAFCDLAFCPVSYDFVTWLVRAMYAQRARHCKRLHVVLVPKEDGLGGFARSWGKHDAAAARWRLWHIAVASCPLAGATVTVTATRAQAEAMRQEPCWWPEGRAHLAGWMIEHARAGGFVPKLQPTAAAVRYAQSAWQHEKIVTLTMRSQETDESRNSDMDAALAMCGWLREKGYHPIGIADTHEVLMKGGAGAVALSPDLRLALYQRAAMNLIGNNGPAVLLWHSIAPFLQFNVALPAAEWKAHYEEHLSLRPGDQLPWARPDQRLIYRPDSFDVMREEFERWAGATS